MTKLMISFYETERKFDAAAERFFFHHPYLGLVTVFIGMPIFILSAVVIGTAAIMLALSLLFGWV